MIDDGIKQGERLTQLNLIAKKELSILSQDKNDITSVIPTSDK